VDITTTGKIHLAIMDNATLCRLLLNLWQDKTSCFTGTLPVSASHWQLGFTAAKRRGSLKNSEKSNIFDNKNIEVHNLAFTSGFIVILACN